MADSKQRLRNVDEHEEEDDDDEETRLRDRLLAKRARQLKELIAAEPTDNSSTISSDKATSNKKSHHHKKKKRKHDSEDEEMDSTTKQVDRLPSLVSMVSSQPMDFVEEEGLNIKPPQATSSSDQKRHKKRKSSKSDEKSPDRYKKEGSDNRYPKQRVEFYDNERRYREKVDEGWASWKKSLNRPINYGRGPAAPLYRGGDQRPSRSPRSDRHGYRRDDGRSPPSFSSRWPKYESDYRAEHSQVGQDMRKGGDRDRISYSSSSTTRNRLEKESAETRVVSTKKLPTVAAPATVEIVSPEATPTMDEHDDSDINMAHDQKKPAGDVRPRKRSEDKAVPNERPAGRSESRSSGSTEKSLPSSMESGEHRSEDERSGDKSEKQKATTEAKKSKYSKFESSSSESDDSDKEPDEANQQSDESDQEPDHDEGKDEVAAIATDPADLNLSPASEFEIEPALPIYYPALMGCRSVEEFQSLNRIEEGTYGVVYRAKEKRTDEIVALKRLKMEKEKEGFPITSLREINMLLKAGMHPNIVKVREIVVGSNMDKIYLVMDYVEHDLKSLMETMKQPFLIGEVKTLLKQLLSGVKHLHENWILHRDLKTSNLLLSHRGILKIADFGLAREYGSPLKPYTPIVVTLWYRAPELLLGIKEYSTPIDIWSVGCIFAEILTLKPFFTGKSEIEQLNRIFKVLGTPNDTIWPGYSELPGVKRVQFVDVKYNFLRKSFGATLSDKGFGLLNRLLTYDPVRRISAAEALEEDWFKEEPRPVRPELFPTWPAKSEQSRAPKKGTASPKPPSGGKQFLQGESDKDYLAGLKGRSGVSGAAAVPGFSLKFDAPKF